MDVRILYRDAQIAVVCKPCGVLSENSAAEAGMPARLREQLGGDAFPVHRLDRTTCGLMVYARTRAAAARLSAAVQEGALQKEYLAVVEGVPAGRGELCDLLYYDRARGKSYVVARARKGVKEARLRYERLASALHEGREVSLVRVELLTGRTHQIRVQFASRRHPLVGDRRYGGTAESENIALCACRLCFPHPAAGERMGFEIPPEGEAFEWFTDK